MNARVLCGHCDTYHVPGECPDGAPAPSIYCPWCARDGRGRMNELTRLINTDTMQYQLACIRCTYGHTQAKRRGKRGGRGRRKPVKR